MKLVKRRHRSVVLATASVVLVLVLAACGGGATEPAGDDAGADASTQGEGEDQQGGGDAQQGGVLTVATGQDAIPQLDPGLATFHWEWVLYPLLWDGLTYMDEASEIQPWLATSWTANDEFTEWEFELRDDVVFSNDRPLVADDIVWNIERVLEPENASIARSYLAAVSEATADDDHTVTVRLDEPMVTLPTAISHLRIIAPESLETINEEPVGTGPFTVESFVPSQSLELVRNDDYWGEEPPLDGIRFQAVNDSAAGVTALRSGDIHVLWNIPADDAASLEAAPDVRIEQPEVSTTLHYLFTDTASPPFDDVRARQALAHAFDREAVRDTAYSGFGTAATRNTPIPPGTWAADEDLPEYTLDLDRAKDLFEQAGVTEGSTLTWWGIAGAYSEWQTEAQLLQSNLAEIGITLDIQNNEVGTWVDAFLPQGKEFPGYIIPNQGGDPNDPHYLFNRLVNGVNEGNWRSDELDELAARAAATDDEAERAEIYGEMQQLVDEEAPIVASMHSAMLTGVREEVSGLWTSTAGNLQLDQASLSR